MQPLIGAMQRLKVCLPICLFLSFAHLFYFQPTQLMQTMGVWSQLGDYWELQHEAEHVGWLMSEGTKQL